MFLIPGILISCATFPGVIVHELAHKLFCLATGTHVFETKYFQLKNPCGYVLHERPSNVWKQLLICGGPLALNTALACLLGLSALLLNKLFQCEALDCLALWLGISIGMHSFPSTGDGDSLWAAIWSKDAPFSAKIVGAPVVACINLVAAGSFFWLDFWYGALAVSVPALLLGFA